MIMIVGAPGAGKSVQAQLIEQEANVKWLSTGQLLRDNQTEEQKKMMEQGVLVGDAVVEDILAEAINNVSNGTRILIDGFPRNNTQVNWFRGYIKAAKRDLEAIVHIKVPVEEVVDRLLKRGRTDDKEEVIRHRYKLYEDEILPMLDDLSRRGTRIIEIDGMQKVEDIHSNIMNSLKGTI